MSGTVLVIGPSTFVGSRLVPHLLANGHRVVGVSPRPAIARIFLPEESGSFTVATADAARELTGDPQALSIVNLAAIGDVPSPDLLSRDRRTRARWRRGVATSIAELAPRGCRQLIHVSTAAVFGNALAAAPAPGNVRWRPMDDREAESEILMERTMTRLAGNLGCESAVLRLGNVIGPAAPLWIAGLAQRVMEMKPVAYVDQDGFSNTTYVDNVSDYIGTVISRPAGALRDFGTHHHLAEFSAQRWSALLDVIGEVVGCRWIAARPKASASLLGNALKAGSRSAPGTYARLAIELAPDWGVFGRLPNRTAHPPAPKATATEVDPSDIGLLAILSARHEFRSHTLDGWEPPVGFGEACGRIAEWLGDAAYGLRPPSSNSP